MNKETKVKTIFDINHEWVWKAAPLALILVTIVKYLLFSMGLMYQENIVEKIISYICYSCFFGFCFLVVINIIRKEENKRYIYKLLLLMMCVYILMLFGIIKFGLNRYILKMAMQNMLFCMPAMFIGGMTAYYKKERIFLEQIDKYMCLIVLPVLGYFFMAVADANPFYNGTYIGTMNYFSVGYYLMPFFFVNCFLLNEENFPVRNKEKKYREPLRIALLLIIWLDIIASGTRGAIGCCIIFMAAYTLYRLFHKQKVKKMLCISLSFVSVYLVFLFVYTPPGFAGISRMDIVLQGSIKGELVSSDVIDEDKLAEIFQSNQSGKGNLADNSNNGNSANKGNMGNAANNKGSLADNTDKGNLIHSGSEEPEENESDEIVISDRGQLFKLAGWEIVNNPITGLGPLGFSVKYNNYPHNIFLEILAELGVLIGGGISIFVIYIIIRLLLCVKKDYDMGLMLIFFFGYGFSFLISGTVWGNSSLYFVLGYGVIYCFEKKKGREELHEGKNGNES